MYTTTERMKKRGRTVSEEAELMRRWHAQSAATEFNAHTQQGIRRMGMKTNKAKKRSFWAPEFPPY